MTDRLQLSGVDMTNLRFERPESPFHVAGLAILEATPLVDVSGALRLEELRRELNARLANVPALRRRVVFTGPFRGRGLWVADDRFDIRNHVREASIDPPGDESQLLEAAANLYAPLLNRSRPLWELWFLTGLRDGRIGMLLKLHHALADGFAALALIGSLLDGGMGMGEAPEVGGFPETARAAMSITDQHSSTLMAERHAARRLLHPETTLHSLAAISRELVRTFSEPKAPVTSLTGHLNPTRQVRCLPLELEAVRERAHAAGGTVNDVVLDLYAHGLRALLTARGESVDGLDLVSSMAVSLRPRGDLSRLGNRVGVMTVRLPVGEADPVRRLALMAARTQTAKSSQHPAAVQGTLGVLSRTWLAQLFIRRQRRVNVFSTNLVGPPVPISFLGAPIVDVIPIVPLAGNVRLSLCALSYAGRLNLSVAADAAAFPDLEVLMSGMAEGWGELVDTLVRTRPA